MKRDEFLTTFAIGIAAACTGCLAACNKGDDGEPTVQPPPPPANVSITVDLNTDLKNVGDSKIVNSIIIVRLAATNAAASFTAVQSACTHQGTTIGFNTNQQKFICPNHGSQFSTSGAVQNGPATVDLKKYNVSVSGNTLTVTG